MNDNLFRRVNWLWKHRHTHNGDDLQEQITIIRTQVEGQSDDITVGGSGAYIHLTVADQTIGVGGEDVAWAGSNPLGLFDFQPVFPTTTIQVLKSGYYNLAVPVLEWGSWVFGGAVSIWRNDIKVWPPPDDAGWSTNVKSVWRADAAHAVWFDAGDTFRLFIDHGSGSSQVLAHAALSAYLVDRAGRPEWELVFPADNYGVTWDGTNWWTTLGNVDDTDPALFKRAADGTIVNSYNGFDQGPDRRSRGLVYADGFLWGVGQEPKVHKINPATGSVDSTFATSGTFPGNTDITYDGTNLFVVQREETAQIEEYSLAGVLQGTHSHPPGRMLRGLAWNGSGFWAGQLTPNTILQLSSSFVELSTIDGPPVEARGMHYQDGFLYAMTPTGLYRRAL